MERHEELNRVISRRMLLIFVIGDVLGAGIYALVGEVAGEVGGAIWTGFALAGVIAAFTAASYAELVSKFPQAAGAALYVHKAFKAPLFTFVVYPVLSKVTKVTPLRKISVGLFMSTANMMAAPAPLPSAS